MTTFKQQIYEHTQENQIVLVTSVESKICQKKEKNNFNWKTKIVIIKYSNSYVKNMNLPCVLKITFKFF